MEASAPVRICDIGGWTDTWFGGPGRVVNLAVRPGVRVSVALRPGEGVVLNLADFGDRYPVMPGAPRTSRHRLMEAAVDAIPPPRGREYEFTVRSGMPAGSGAGTSAAVSVAMLGALAAVSGQPVVPERIARMAHGLEVEILGGESGVQDQWSAAFGGINYLEVDPYPEVARWALPPWPELGRRLTLVFLGRPHDSSQLHRQVIAKAAGGGVGPFPRLREAAAAAREAVVARDLDRFAWAMVLNTEAQSLLHEDLVGSEASEVMRAAASAGAIGWKVNGAGGDGGSVTVLSPTEERKAAVDRDLAAMGGRLQLIPVELSAEGLSVRLRPTG